MRGEKKYKNKTLLNLRLCPHSLHMYEKRNGAVEFLLVRYHGDGGHMIASPDSPLQESPNLIIY